MRPESFRVELDREGEALVVRPVGELDLATVSELERAIGDADPAPLLVLDLSALEFLDTSGMRFLLKTQSDCLAAGRGMRLVRGPREVQRLFDVAGFTDRLPLDDSVEAALAKAPDA